MSAEMLLEACHIDKRYPGQVALDDVTFRVRRGAVNVLIGENGAGKSTLMRVLAGVEQPDGGKLRMEGRMLVLRTPREAAGEGISIVHQELALMPNLDVAENVFAGRELVRSAGLGRLAGFIDKGREDAASEAAMEQLGGTARGRTSVGVLSLGSRQLVELARAMAHGARVVILDEPTSALSSAETESLFRVIAMLKAQGVGIVYISHRLHELLHLGDWFTVLRNGRVVGEGERGEVDRAWIVERMSGRKMEMGARSRGGGSGDVALEMRGVSVAAEEEQRGRLGGRDVRMTLRREEIVGVYGLLGSGRTEMLEALAGERAITSGSVLMRGRQVALDSVARARKAGIVLVPEDRQRDGLVPELSIRENIALGARGWWIKRGVETASVRRVMDEMQLKAANMELPVTSLSGGNQQKVILARCLMADPEVLLLDEPTRGVDVGAKAEIYEILRGLAERGLAILFASSEIEEMRALADRAVVLRGGVVARIFSRTEMTDEGLFAEASPVVGQAERVGG